MTPNIKPLVCGNWKMNGLKAQMSEFEAIQNALTEELAAKVDLGICPPFTLISTLADKASKVTIGAQDCHANEKGAHTGDISAPMLADLGANGVICGHSERRTDHGESDADVCQKAQAILNSGMAAIICVGETKDEREAGKAIEIVTGQLEGSVPNDFSGEIMIAYEPVWAIGTGLVPSAQDVEQMHLAIRESLQARFGAKGEGVRILYGGSVKPNNAVELMAIANVDGALVGGASLKAQDFLGIAKAYLEI